MRAPRREDEVREHFAARAPAMRRRAFLIVRDWHTAEDMVQATFVQLYLHWPRIRRDTVDAYTRRVLVNQCLSHLRKHRREELTDARWRRCPTLVEVAMRSIALETPPPGRPW